MMTTAATISLVLRAICLAVFADVLAAAICRTYPQTEQLEFTRETNRQDFAKAGEAKILICCAKGFQGSVQWYMYQKYPPPGRDVPFPAPNNSFGLYHPSEGERGQKVTILKVGEQHETNYTCVAHNETAVIRKTLELIVIDCEPLTGLPKVISEPRDSVVNIGDDVSMTCGGYFGCNDDQLRNVIWGFISSLNDTKRFVPVEGHSKRYSTNSSAKVNRTELYSTFTIHDINKSDLELEFICLLGNTRGSVNRTVHLTRKVLSLRHDNTVLVGGLSAGVAVVVIAVLGTIALLVKHLWGPQIILFIRKKMGTLMGPRDEGCDYDVVLVCASEDERVAAIIQEELANRKYKVFGPNDLSPGSPKAEIMKAMARCVVRAFLYSENTRQETMVSFVLNVAMANAAWNNIIVIHCDAPLDSSQGDTMSVVWRKAVEVACTDDDTGCHGYDPSDGGVIEFPPLLGNGATDSSALEIPDNVWRDFRSAQWPGVDSCQRKMENFFSDLELLLPRVSVT